MTLPSEELQAMRERYDRGLEQGDIASHNIAVFKSIIRTLEVDNLQEVPIHAIVTMYPNYGYRHSMHPEELTYRIMLLEQAGYISFRIASFGLKMVSITELGIERYNKAIEGNEVV